MFGRPFPATVARRRVIHRFRQPFSALVLGTVVLLGFGCAKEEEELVIADDSAFAAFTDTSLALPPLRFPDGQVTLNDRCPVRKVRLNPRMPAVYVNQHPIGFC